MNLPHSAFILSCVLFEVIGLAIYLRGFLALKTAVPGYASVDDQPAEPLAKGDTHQVNRLPPGYGRLVVVLIDALRADFVLPNQNNDLPTMKFVSDMIQQGETLSFQAKAHPPTVTLPRIKALTTGGIPGFIDVVLNFDSAALQEDNLVHQLDQSGRHLVFYGDDTWIKLFPQHFIRTEGTTSFFVTDFTEVDNNVTRHLDSELSSSDWDVMILHYLGLDHIGHLAGPRSPLVPPKLAEMDDIIRRIYNSLKIQDRERELPSLLLVCGDHGMSDQGSHGGSSPSETATPIVLLAPNMNHKPANSAAEVQQIDLVPTLALLLGIPIPQNSLGVAIEDVIMTLPMRDQLKAMHMNAQQILRVFKENVPRYTQESPFQVLRQAINLHTRWLNIHLNATTSVDEAQMGNRILRKYREALTRMRDQVAASLTSYDLHAMYIGITVLWLVLSALIYGNYFRHSKLEVTFTMTGTLLFLSLLALLTSSHITECTGVQGSNLLCQKHLVTMAMMAAIFIVTSLCLTVGILLVLNHRSFTIFQISSALNKLLQLPWCQRLLVFGTMFHSVTLLASSFIEEEHQTWYFFTTTMHLLLTAKHVASLMQYYSATQMGLKYEHVGISESDILESSLQEMEIKNLHIKLYGEKQSQYKSTEVTDGRSKQKGDGRSVREVAPSLQTVREARSAWHSMVYSVVVVVLGRVLRAWNRTGDKWSHLPDIGDWLVRPENKVYESVLVGMSLSLILVVYGSSMRTSYLSLSLMAAGLTAVYCFRAANGALVLPGFYGNVNKGITEARIAYSIIIMVFIKNIYAFYKNKRSHGCKSKLEKCQSEYFGENNEGSVLKYRESPWTKLLLGLLYCWTLLISLLARPHNITMVAMMVLQEFCMRRFLQLQIEGTTVSAITLLYFWMGQAAFFYQGNSNSISTVDVSAGYVGLEDYQPALIGLLMVVSTYAGPVFWLIALAAHISSRHRQERVSWSVDVGYTLCLTRALPLAVFTALVTAQRYHLFVWTVFSPKLLYEGMYTLVMSSVILLTVVCSGISR